MNYDKDKVDEMVLALLYLNGLHLLPGFFAPMDDEIDL